MIGFLAATGFCSICVGGVISENRFTINNNRINGNRR